MKTVHVVAAIICDSLNRKAKVFATERGYGDFAGRWEFPGGKVEPGELPQQALVREIREELGCVIEVQDLAATVEYDYPDFHLTMDCFWCQVLTGEIELREAHEGRWLNRESLCSVDWLPADKVLVERLREQMQG